MTTFDLADVRGFAADLDAGMNRCDDGEGKECPTLDDVLRHYAGLCSEFSDQVRRWGDAVFSGRSKFDPEVERVFRGEGRSDSTAGHWRYRRTAVRWLPCRRPRSRRMSLCTPPSGTSSGCSTDG